MALAAALAVLMALLPPGLASQDTSTNLTVTCKEDGSPPPQTVTAANTVLTVLCPDSWTIAPPAKDGKVCETAACTGPVPLTTYAPGAEAVAVDGPKPGMKITFKELPPTSRTFFLNCNEAGNKKKCDVEVILNKPATGSPGADGVPRPPPGTGTPSVQICENQKFPSLLCVLGVNLLLRHR